MRTLRWVGLLCAAGFSMAISACGDGGGNGGSGGGTGGSTGTTTSTTTEATSSSTGGEAKINGCGPSDFVAPPSMPATVSFTCCSFSPPCLKVPAGTDVTFAGSFAEHPLEAGDVGPPATTDPNSPIKPTSSGASVTFTMATPGTYPFYCMFHDPTMAGAILVE
jgi:plastocyanin